MAVRKDEFHALPGTASSQLLAAYREMLLVLRLPAVRSLAVVLLTCKAPLAAFELLVPLELQASGVPKEMLATLTTLMLPVTMLVQAYVSQGFGASGRSKPMKVFMRAYAGRLVVGCALILLVYFLGVAARGGGGIPLWLYAFGTVTSCAAAAASATMFVSQMAFYSRISDPKIGGTYMTMLNTMSNLGGQWPGTLVLATKGAIERLPGKPDGFFGVALSSLILGVGWYLLMRRRVSDLQAKPKESWLSSH
jgi:PAT family acetyl-CoA transporter-like MFS transporter 1